jgi:hypothetical protein
MTPINRRAHTHTHTNHSDQFSSACLRGSKSDGWTRSATAIGNLQNSSARAHASTFPIDGGCHNREPITPRVDRQLMLDPLGARRANFSQKGNMNFFEPGHHRRF